MTPLATIHVAKKELDLDDDTYRAVLMRVTGKASAKDMSEAERGRVVEEFRRQGFRPLRQAPLRQAQGEDGTNGASRGLEGPFAKKLQALWIAAWNLGLVRDRRDAAMLAFVRRQTGIEHTRFLRDATDARRAIEALKGWMARDAKVDWSDGNNLPAWRRLPGARIALAQWELLHDGFDWVAFRGFVEEHSFNPVTQMTAREWAGVMNRLGERVRQGCGA